MRSFRMSLFLSLLVLLFSSGAYADPPNRVARMSYIQGAVSFSPVDAARDVWLPVKLNRPLIAGDRLWADAHSRAELQLGNGALRLEDETSIRILNLNDRIAQFDLSEGSVTLSVRQLYQQQIFEINTPQLAFKIAASGDYRVDVDDRSTTITIRRGKGTVYTRDMAYKIGPGSYRYAERKFHPIKVFTLDEFDRWSYGRERLALQSPSARYVSTTLIGYEDLDTYGSWRSVPTYGKVWVPRRLPARWAPYRYGHWSWINPWGWTWIDDQPWGFATTHYGRWAYYQNTWMWVPGRKVVHASYAPALVAFIGGKKSGVSISIGTANPGVAWMPLGPRDVYVPPYKVSKRYFQNINATNTTINQTHITNVYAQPAKQTIYTYHQMPQAVTVVPTKTFVKSEPVAQTAVTVSPAVISQTPVTTTVEVAPAPTPAVDSAGQPQSTGTVVAKPSDSTLNKEAVVVTKPDEATHSTETVTTVPETTVNAKPVESTVVVPSTTGEVPAAVQPEPVVKEADKVVTEPEVKVDVDQNAAAEKIKAEEAAKAEAAKVEAAKADAEKAAAAEVEAEKAAAAKAEAEKAAATAAQAESDRIEAEKAQAARVESEKAEAAKAQAEKAEAVKAEAEQARVEAEKAEAARVEAEKAEAARVEAEKAEAARVEAEKAEAARVEAEKAEAARVEAEKAEAARVEAEKAEAARVEAEKTEAARVEAEKAEAARVEAEKAEAARAEAEKAAAAKAEADKAEAARVEAEKAAAAKAEADKAAAAKAEADKAAAPTAPPAAAPSN